MKARCAPLADLFMDLAAGEEFHTRRQMAQLCQSCPLLESCDTQADAAIVKMIKVAAVSRTKAGLTVGFRAGLSQRQRITKVRSAA